MARIWGKLGKLFGSLFLYSGGITSAGILTGIATSHASGGFLTLLSVLLVFLGIAPASLGSWLLITSSKLERQAIRERFFELLRMNRGRLSLLDFAAATRLEPAIARRQLDNWAKEFSASFEVSDGGDIYYIFTADPLSLSERAGTQQGQLRQRLQSVG